MYSRMVAAVGVGHIPRSNRDGEACEPILARDDKLRVGERAVRAERRVKRVMSRARSRNGIRVTGTQPAQQRLRLLALVPRPQWTRGGVGLTGRRARGYDGTYDLLSLRPVSA